MRKEQWQRKTELESEPGVDSTSTAAQSTNTDTEFYINFHRG